METWLKISLLLCSFGFFREMRPSEPFVVEFLSGDWRNLTAEDINKFVYPFGTYSVLTQLVVVFLITDMLRYKPLIVVSAIAGIILFAILLWTRQLWELLVGQCFFGTFMASEVAYYTYIYAKVDRERFQIVTGHTRAAILCGKFLGGVLAQALVSTDTMSYRELHFISFGSQLISLPISIALPPVRASMYFYSTQSSTTSPPAGGGKAAELDGSSEPQEVPKFSVKNAGNLLWKHAKSAYSNPVVVQWSIWWALATCGQIQAISYVQFLWKEIHPLHDSVYNGGVEATVTLLGAGAAMIAGTMNKEIYRGWHMWIITVGSVLMGAFLISAALTMYVWVAYGMYVIFGICYFFVITIGAATVAEHLEDDSFGLIFGINTLLALTCQTILTVVVVTETGFTLLPRPQFIVYGSYFIVMSIAYSIAVTVLYVVRRFSNKVE